MHVHADITRLFCTPPRESGDKANSANSQSDNLLLAMEHAHASSTNPTFQ